MHAHFSGNMAEYHVPVFQLDAERGIGEILHDLSLHFNYIFLGHASTTGKSGALEVGLFQQAFILVRHGVSLDLGHEVHGYNHNDQQ